MPTFVPTFFFFVVDLFGYTHVGFRTDSRLSYFCSKSAFFVLRIHKSSFSDTHPDLFGYTQKLFGYTFLPQFYSNSLHLGCFSDTHTAFLRAEPFFENYCRNSASWHGFRSFSDAFRMLFGYRIVAFRIHARDLFGYSFFFGRGLILALFFLLFGYTQKLFGYTPFLHYFTQKACSGNRK